MDFTFSEEQEHIRNAIERLCQPFDDDYWHGKDSDGTFPQDFHKALGDAGWLGIAMPEEYGGAGLGITEAALMMQTISATGAGLSGASAVHMIRRQPSAKGLQQGRPEHILFKDCHCRHFQRKVLLLPND